jgi:phenylpropionate dioxygenase-like ring-hydroxylating dioxygenase large terminal subunit
VKENAVMRDETSTQTMQIPEIQNPVAEGWTLPASWYADVAVSALERERIFARAWQYAGRTDQVAGPGEYFVSQAGHVPILVVRGRDEALRAFVNVCRHRGHPVASGAGCRETLQCPYHAWTYDLDGSLRRAPRSEREPGFDPSGLSLRSVSVETWGPFVFVNPDADASPLADTLGGLPALVAESGVDLSRLRFHSHDEWPINSNWKVAVENFLECYHCPVAHPGFSKVIDVDPDAYLLSVSESYSSQVGKIRPSALADNGRAKGKAPYVPRGDVTQAQYHLIWPNTTISIEAGPMNVAMERWVPTGLGTSLEVTDYFFGEDVPEAQVQEVIEFGSQVGMEDLALCESVQAGLESRMVPQGRLMLGSEPLIHDFQKKVVAALVG